MENFFHSVGFTFIVTALSILTDILPHSLLPPVSYMDSPPSIFLAHLTDESSSSLLHHFILDHSLSCISLIISLIFLFRLIQTTGTVWNTMTIASLQGESIQFHAVTVLSEAVAYIAASNGIVVKTGTSYQ